MLVQRAPGFYEISVKGKKARSISLSISLGALYRSLLAEIFRAAAKAPMGRQVFTIETAIRFFGRLPELPR